MRLVLDQGKTVSLVAHDLNLTASSLAIWVKQARADRTNGNTGLTTEERAELAQSGARIGRRPTANAGTALAV